MKQAISGFQEVHDRLERQKPEYKSPTHYRGSDGYLYGW